MSFPNQNPAHALIVGASQGIGLGFVKKLLNNDKFNKIYATYRNPESATELKTLATENSERLQCLKVDIINEVQIEEAVKQIKTEVKTLHLAINSVGVLHEGNLQPEKSLKHVNLENLTRYFQINSIGGVLLAKHLLPLFKHQDKSVFASISAKVGSIGDNNLGGWYGYRASKTALNMFMRNVSIEYARSCPKNIVVTLHPGTTNTRLSQPFQSNVPPEKLFSIDRTVNQLIEVIEKLEPIDSGQFFSWDGNKLSW
ncbi:MAG: SDR family NAD(P)-dependent oxidoreductase [Calothrix sp. C42_A2020_038]|nr:SDR family NAD(P)-dependent oxidoreductase [Calothrix sp. C42_A2020_038]